MYNCFIDHTAFMLQQFQLNIVQMSLMSLKNVIWGCKLIKM